MTELILITLLAVALPAAEDAAPSCPDCDAPAVQSAAPAAQSNCSYREAVRQSNQNMRGVARWYPGKMVVRSFKGMRKVQVASVANRADRGRLIPQWRTKKTLARRGR